MKKTLTFLLALLPITLAILVGYTVGGAVAFRQQQANDMGSLLSESFASKGASVSPEESNEYAETLVTTAQARLPRQPSLVTLAVGDDLMTKINNASGPVLLDTDLGEGRQGHQSPIRGC